MSVIRWSSLSVLLVVATACTDGIAAPPAGFAHAVATFACGPADGPAVAIYLTPNLPVPIPPGVGLQLSGPVVRVYINRPVEEIGGKAWPIGDTSEATALFVSANNSFEIAKTGYVITSSVGSDKTIVGSVSLTFPNAGHIEGGFHAEWSPQAGPLCG